jgi:hypothetical protein
VRDKRRRVFNNNPSLTQRVGIKSTRYDARRERHKIGQNWHLASGKMGTGDLRSAGVFSDPAEAVANCLFSSWKLETI